MRSVRELPWSARRGRPFRRGKCCTWATIGRSRPVSSNSESGWNPRRVSRTADHVRSRSGPRAETIPIPVTRASATRAALAHVLDERAEALERALAGGLVLDLDLE